MLTRPIADELDIRSLVHRYADAAYRRDPAAVASTFTNDGEWHAPELGHHKGRDAMIAVFTSMLDGWSVFLQGLQSGVVTLNAADADHATGRWFVQEVGQRTEGTNLTIAGVYHDEYRRETGVWLIMRRRYDPLLRSVGGCLLRRKARRVNHSCDPPGRGGHVGRSSNRGAGCDVDLLRHDLMTVGAQRVGGRLQTNLIDVGEHDHASGAARRAAASPSRPRRQLPGPLCHSSEWSSISLSQFGDDPWHGSTSEATSRSAAV